MTTDVLGNPKLRTESQIHFLMARGAFALQAISFGSIDMFDKSSVSAMFDEHIQTEDAIKKLQQAGSDMKKQSIVRAPDTVAVVSGAKVESARTQRISRPRKAEDDLTMTPWNSAVPSSVERREVLPLRHSRLDKNTTEGEVVMRFKNMRYSGNGEGHLAKRNRHPLATMQREIDLAVEKACQALEFGNPRMLSGVTEWPAIDVTEDEKTLMLRADVTGVDPKDLDVEITGNQLSIHCSRKEERTEDKRGHLYYEGRAGGFSRTLSLPPCLDCDKIDARYEKGMLTIAIPKIPDQDPKRIPVNTT